MATIRKQLDLDETLLDKVQQTVGQGISFTWLVEKLLWNLVDELEAKNFSLSQTMKNATRNFEVPETSSLPSDEL